MISLHRDRIDTVNQVLRGGNLQGQRSVLSYIRSNDIDMTFFRAIKERLAHGCEESKGLRAFFEKADGVLKNQASCRCLSGRVER